MRRIGFRVPPAASRCYTLLSDSSAALSFHAQAETRPPLAALFSDKPAAKRAGYGMISPELSGGLSAMSLRALLYRRPSEPQSIQVVFDQAIYLVRVRRHRQEIGRAHV